ncbi:hypothetical protein FRX31_003512, partial [Thalictrum thalictroides]
MESDGELVKIDQHIALNTLSLFKLNDSKTGWVELIQNDQDNRSWVLYHQHQNLHCAAHGFSIKQSDSLPRNCLTIPSKEFAIVRA